MDSLVKINIGAAPNDGTGDPARDAFAKHNKNIDSIANALGAANGIGTLGSDGRQVPGEIPNGQLLPTSAHDLNNYTAPGPYYQGAVAAATLANNYPAASITGFLLVETFGTATLQQFMTRNAPYRSFWRIKTGTGANAWSGWIESSDITTAFSFQGSMPASPAQDLNTYTQRGQWQVGSSAVAAAGANFPIAQSGNLLVYSGGYPGGPVATGCTQIYLAANSNRAVFRSLVSGNWSAWEEVIRSSLLGAVNGVGTLDANGRQPVGQAPYSAVLPAGTDANTLATPGVWHINSDAQATAALNWPQQLAGTLSVEAVAAGNMQVTQTYTTRNGTGGVFRTYKRVRFGAGGGTWGTWQEVARLADAMQHGQCRFLAISGTECRLVQWNGNGLVINGKQYRIPASGVSVSNAGLVTGTLYYCYAKDDGSGGIALEFQSQASAPRSRHTDGVEIKTGDPTRTLVGMVFTNGSPAGFINSGTTRWVSSWFNRIEAATAETPVNSPTSATSYVKLTNGLYPMLWAGDTALVAASGIVTTSVAAMGAYHIMTVNGTGYAGGFGYTLASPGYQYPSVCVAPYIANSDGMYNFALYGMSGSASAAITFRHDLNCRWPQ